MTGMSGRAAVTANLRQTSTASIPSVDLPVPLEQLAADAAARLGWSGRVLPPMTLLGRRVVVVAEVLPDAHAERICLGYPPVSDRAAVSTWVWPELAAQAPPAAVRITGVLTVARHWRTALASAVPFTSYADVAAVLPWWAATTHDYLVNCLPRARRYGVSILTADPEGVTDVDVPGPAESPAARNDATGRWLNETVYESFLALASE